MLYLITYYIGATLSRHDGRAIVFHIRGRLVRSSNFRSLSISHEKAESASNFALKLITAAHYVVR